VSKSHAAGLSDGPVAVCFQADDTTCCLVVIKYGGPRLGADEFTATDRQSDCQFVVSGCARVPTVHCR
jgi:hypothetical protein